MLISLSFQRSAMPRKPKVYRCNCAQHCKIPTGKRVEKSTYYAHAVFRKSLSPIPGGFRNLNDLPEFEEVNLPGQAPPIADILGGYPNLNLGHQDEVRKHRAFSGVMTELFNLSLPNNFRALHYLRLDFGPRCVHFWMPFQLI